MLGQGLEEQRGSGRAKLSCVGRDIEYRELKRRRNSALQATVQDTENRIARLLFKQSVELDMVMNVLAAGMEIPEEQLEKLRGQCVYNVKKTNGSVSLDEAVRYQRGGDR